MTMPPDRETYDMETGHRIKGLPDPAGDHDTLTKVTLDSVLESMRGDQIPSVAEAWKRAATTWRNVATLSLCFVLVSIFALAFFGMQHGRTVARLENIIDAKDAEIRDLKANLKAKLARVY
jgi:hypothetical protein